ncbi:ankyrin repeat domain-containing protein [Vibrio breoganii]|uniref:ankyrin repeat domain-containing protein n=2 Tax=Vibrio TaxID=662 RepID=UPI001054D5CA|nr:ankyrin repeat domain-containing protein [Vibrio breoganii]
MNKNNISMADIQSLLGTQPERTMTRADKKIIKLCLEKKYEQIMDLPKKDLAAFSNEQRQNLALVAAILDDVTLFNIAVNAGVDLHQRDMDNFWLMDICVENNSLRVSERALAITTVKESINSQSPIGFTCSHHAVMRSRYALLATLKKAGANFNIENAVGQTVSKLLSEFLPRGPKHLHLEDSEEDAFNSFLSWSKAQ